MMVIKIFVLGAEKTQEIVIPAGSTFVILQVDVPEAKP